MEPDDLFIVVQKVHQGRKGYYRGSCVSTMEQQLHFRTTACELLGIFGVVYCLCTVVPSFCFLNKLSSWSLMFSLLLFMKPHHVRGRVLLGELPFLQTLQFSGLLGFNYMYW